MDNSPAEIVLSSLKDFRQFSGESAFRFLITLFTAAPISTIALLFRPCTRTSRTRRTRPRRHGTLGRLRGIGTKDFVLERSSVETPDNGLHFVRCGGFHEREALRLLRFVIPDDLNRIRDKVLSSEPLFNVVSRDPSGQIAQKDGKAHSVA